MECCYKMGFSCTKQLQKSRSIIRLIKTFRIAFEGKNHCLRTEGKYAVEEGNGVLYLFTEVVQDEVLRKGGAEVDHQEEGKGNTVI